MGSKHLPAQAYYQQTILRPNRSVNNQILEDGLPIMSAAAAGTAAF